MLPRLIRNWERSIVSHLLLTSIVYLTDPTTVHHSVHIFTHSIPIESICNNNDTFCHSRNALLTPHHEVLWLQTHEKIYEEGIAVYHKINNHPSKNIHNEICLTWWINYFICCQNPRLQHTALWYYKIL
jgi:hypothetical protein